MSCVHAWVVKLASWERGGDLCADYLRLEVAVQLSKLPRFGNESTRVLLVVVPGRCNRLVYNLKTFP